MPDNNSVDTTPYFDFEPETGYVFITDGTCRKIWFRWDNAERKAYLYWRKHSKGEEVPFTLGELFDSIVKVVLD